MQLLTGTGDPGVWTRGSEACKGVLGPAVRGERQAGRAAAAPVPSPYEAATGSHDCPTVRAALCGRFAVEGGGAEPWGGFREEVFGFPVAMSPSVRE